MQLTRRHAIQILLAIFALAGFLRFSQLGANSFVADEFLDINSAYGYFQTGEWQAWDFNFGKPSEVNKNDARDERALVYKAQVAALFHFLPPTEATARTVSVLWGLLDILLIFFVAYRMTGKKEIGLIAAFLLAVSISALIFDRRLRMYAMFAPVYLALSWVLFEWIDGKKALFSKYFHSLNERTGMQWLYLIPVGVLGLLALSTHLLTVNIAPVLGIYLILSAVFVFRTTKSWKNKYTLLIGLGLLGLTFVMLIQPKLIGTVLDEFTFLDDHYSYFGYIAENFWHPLIGFLLIIFGGYFLLRKLGRAREALWLSLSFWVPLILAVFFWKQNAGPQYVFFIQSFGLILAGSGLYGLLEWIVNALGRNTKGILWGTLAFLLVLVPNWAYFFQENNTYHETSSGGNPNYRKVFAYVVKNSLPANVLVTRNFRNYYWSGAEVPVYDFGGELSTKSERLTVEALQSLRSEYPTGWVVLSGNDMDYVSNEAEVLLEKEFEQVSNPNVRGDIFVYRWNRTN